MPDASNIIRTVESGARGFAAMMRSGAYVPEDAEMVAKKLDACADEIKRLRAMLEWQPIETVPANGPIDLLWGGRRFIGCNRDPLDKGWRHLTAGIQLILVRNPTHWMPVLPIPADEFAKTRDVFRG